MAQEPLSVLISGGGIAGCALAFMLARTPGFKVKPRVTVVERSPAPRTTGQAVDIRGPGVDVIQRVGLEPEIKAHHTTEKGIQALNGKGQVIATFETTGDAKQQSGTSEYEILRGDMAKLLLDHIGTEQDRGANLNVVYGESIETLDDTDAGVNVTFKNGKVKAQRFDVVVGTDGIGSATRAMIFGKEDNRDHVKESGMYLGFYSIPRRPDDIDYWRWCTIPNGLAMHTRPHRNKTTMGVYLTVTNSEKKSIPEAEAAMDKGVDAEKAYLEKKFQNAGWESERLIAGMNASDDFYMSQWCAVRTPKWTKGRCAILGDAAFATMGVGTSWALVGAYVMAGELAKVSRSEDVPGALCEYESVLRPGFAKDEKLPPGFPQLANPQTAWGVRIFHFILMVVSISRLDRLIMWISGSQPSDEWSPPLYGWDKVPAP